MPPGESAAAPSRGEPPSDPDDTGPYIGTTRPSSGLGRPGRPPGGMCSDLERLMDRTVLGRPHPELGTCWLFTGPADPYGRLGKGPERFVHRLGWKLLRGPIPDGMELHHLCGIHICWNPDHLQVVTHAQNLAYERKTHCRRGHSLSGTNLRIDPRTGTRTCRACSAERQRAFRARQAAAKRAR
jgi:hypothetical protein